MCREAKNILQKPIAKPKAKAKANNQLFQELLPKQTAPKDVQLLVKNLRCLSYIIVDLSNSVMNGYTKTVKWLNLPAIDQKGFWKLSVCQYEIVGA